MLHTKPMTRREWTATGIALLFHISGGIGMTTQYRDWFVALTPLNLGLMALLLWYTQEQKGQAFYSYAAIAFGVGMLAEIIGVNTGYLFGNYAYGEAMGFKLMGVPLLIGVYWFIVTWCVANIISFWWARARGKRRIHRWFMAVGGGLLTTIFDYFMEPGAVALGYWRWLGPGGEIPAFNYLCWFAVSTGLLYFVGRWRPTLGNRFAVALLIMQGLFFVVLKKWL